MLYDSIYPARSRMGKSLETGSRLMVAKDWGGDETGSWGKITGYRSTGFWGG